MFSLNTRKYRAQQNIFKNYFVLKKATLNNSNQTFIYGNLNNIYSYLVSLTAKSTTVVETATAVICPAVITGSTAETSLKKVINDI